MLLSRQSIVKLKNLFINRTISIHCPELAQVSFKLSDIGEGIREVTVKEWFVKVGDKVNQFDEICEVQSDKASVTITSRYDGIIKKLHYSIDQIALVGHSLVDIETEDSDEVLETKQEVENSVENCVKNKNVPERGPNGGTLCIPSVRRLAKEYKVDLTKVKGSGKEGRILKEDVLKYLNLLDGEEGKKVEIRTISKEQLVGDKIERLTAFQKAMTRTMTSALKIPHFVYGDEIKITTLSKIRKTIKDQSPELKLSILPFFIKAVSQALLHHPSVNAVVDDNCENITYKRAHNIGVAMDTKVGLAVPVIKNVEKLSILEINNELNRLISSGKSGNFVLQDLSGGTFTVSNIGAIGGTYMTPVIMPPQVALIALGTAQVLPRFDSLGKVIAEEILNISGVADHRVIDGATMARFVQSVKKQIENPYLLFLNF